MIDPPVSSLPWLGGIMVITYVKYTMGYWDISTQWTSPAHKLPGRRHGGFFSITNSDVRVIFEGGVHRTDVRKCKKLTV